MKFKQIAYVVIISGATGCFGYWLRAQPGGSASFLGAKSIPEVDTLIVHESFSRIKNTREDLEGLRKRLQLEAEVRLAAQARLQAQGASGAVAKALLAGIARDLEAGMSEFEASNEELYLAEDLLRAFKRADQPDRWVDLYLKALYEHPTHQIVALFAVQAIPMGNAAGRADEVIAGLTHLSNIPLHFQGKDKVETVLAKANRRNQFTRSGVGVIPTAIN